MAEPRRTHDPRTLRAIAHPTRSRILDELHAAGPLRAADVARLLQLPANQASFHLRQLAKYGLIEPAPELARDGRDRVWRTTGGGTHHDDSDLADPDLRAAHEVFMGQKAAWAQLLVDRAFAPKETTGTFYAVLQEALRLSKDEGEEFMDEVGAVVERWSQKTRGQDPARRTYAFLSLVQPYPDVDPDA